MPISLSRSRSSDSAPTEARINAQAFDSFILVVPTKRRLRHLIGEVLAAEQKALPALPGFTLELLARNLIQLCFPYLRVIDEPIQTLLFSQAIVASQSEMHYFAKFGRDVQLKRGTFEKIVQVIRNLKESGVYPDTLFDECNAEEENEQPKLRDIATVYSTYERLVGELNAVDVEGLFAAFRECPRELFEQMFRRVFPQVDLIAINGFDEFTQPELLFLQKLCELQTDVSLEFDFQRGNTALFGHLEENYRQFIALGFGHQKTSSSHPTVSALPESQATHLHIADHLFKRTEEVHRRDCKSAVTVVRAKNRISEIELICKCIKQMLVDDPTLDMNKVCVAMYQPQRYTHIMREQFTKFGVPVNVTDRFSLIESPVVVSIVALFETPVRNFHRDAVQRLLASAYFDFTNRGEKVDRANLANASLELRILAGIKSWVTKFDKRIAELEHQAHPAEDDDAAARVRRTLASVKKAKRDIQWLEALLRDVGKEQTAREFQREGIRLIERLDLPRRIVAGTHSALAEKDARAYAKFLEVLNQVVNVLEYQEGKTKVHRLKFFVDQLKVALSEERYNVREQMGKGVLVTSIDETRGLPLDVMIVAGLVDGEFPSVYQSEVFLSAARRKERDQHHTWENRYLFYQAVTNWTRHLYLTYPEQDADLDLVRSSFVDALQNIVEVEEWQYPGSSPLENTIYSKEDFLIQHGRTIGVGAAKPMPVPANLTEEAKNVGHAIAVERSRVDVNNLPEYAGEIFNVLSSNAKEELQKLKHRVYSVSQLESYGKCPYQFFAQRLLRLNAVDEFVEEFSPLEKGSVLHEVLFEFYTTRRDRKLPHLVDCTEKEFAEAHRLLLEIAGRKLAAIDIPDAFWELEKELILGDRETGRGILREFLEHERRRSGSFSPMYFEVGFGTELGAYTRTDETFSAKEPIVAGNIHLRGKVDRVEVGDDAFSIIDYKTGSVTATLKQIRNGLSLQLPIYLYTIEKMLGEKSGKALTPAGGAYYQLKTPPALKVGVGSAQYKEEFGVARTNKNLLETDLELRRLIDESISIVNRYVDEIARGKFPLTTPDKIEDVCGFCDYKTICRIQTVRRIEKPKQEAE